MIQTAVEPAVLDAEAVARRYKSAKEQSDRDYQERQRFVEKWDGPVNWFLFLSLTVVIPRVLVRGDQKCGGS